MKTQHIIYLFLITLVIISGCREITVSTKVNTDGSFTREIKITGDSSDVFKQDLPYPIDSSWVRKAVVDTTDNGDYILTYTKTYKESDQLNNEMIQDTSWRKQLDRKFIIDKRFGFFYSYITFCETYKSINPFQRLNYPNKLSSEEILFLTGEKTPISTSDSVKHEQASDRFEELLIKAIANEIIITLENGIDKLNDPQLNSKNVEKYRDSIENKLSSYYENMDIYIDFYKKWTGNESANELFTISPPLFEDLNKKVSFMLNAIFMDSYSQTVEMPGIITETNSLSVMGNNVSWKVDSDKFIFRDYEMTVESRVVNQWPVIVSGIFLLLVLILIFIKMK